MLPKINRLKSAKEIERVFKKGEGFKGGFLFFKFAGNDLRASRFAFIVSKKTSKKAVVRNRIKRRLGEIVRKKISQMKTGFDAVVVAQKGIEIKDIGETGKDMEALFKRAKILI